MANLFGDDDDGPSTYTSTGRAPAGVIRELMQLGIPHEVAIGYSKKQAFAVLTAKKKAKGTNRERFKRDDEEEDQEPAKPVASSTVAPLKAVRWSYPELSQFLSEIQYDDIGEATPEWLSITARGIVEHAPLDFLREVVTNGKRVIADQLPAGWSCSSQTPVPRPDPVDEFPEGAFLEYGDD